MKSICFSYNRPCQLDLLLRSYKRFWRGEMIVSYTCEKEFEDGYRKVISKHHDIEFIRRVSLKEDILYCMKGERYISIFNDDDVVIRPFNYNDWEAATFRDRRTIISLSTRLGLGYTDYLDQKDVMCPPDKNIWEWNGQALDWGCPFAIMGGSLFKSCHLKPLIEKLEFTTPSNLEPQLQSRTPSVPLMICYKDARTINLPMNKVQTESPDPKFGDITAQFLNEKFMDGYVIDLDDVIAGTKNAKSCFFFYQFKYIKEYNEKN